MRKKYSLLIALSLFSILVQSQDVFKFAIHFTDKDHTPFSIHQPEEFLSQRSIDRRAKFNIGYVEADLPIDPVYIQDVLGATADAHIMIQVKWLNTIIISLSDSANISIIEKLPIVDKIECVLNPNLISKGIDKFSLPTNDLENSFSSYKGVQDYDTAFYGGGWEQIHQMNGEVLHQQGYRGQGMIIAVLDAGFVNVDSLDVFKPLWDNDQILGTKSFVNPGQTVFGYSGHGSYVLSTMGGYWEGQLVGTAPEASYWLLRTEDTSSENIIEEYNWVAGAAFADSVGADVLNTSLGYIDFDDARFNHSYEDMDGNTTVISRGANIAYKRGMLVVNSAGNSGSNSWRYLVAPADATHVFTVGAVDKYGQIAGFSSVGFPWSNDVKPNIVARGAAAYIASYEFNSIKQGNGTSFSSPILSGMATSLWSANPSLSPYMIKQAIQQSASQVMQPDTLYGYGIPNFQVALNILGLEETLTKDEFIQIVPNPIQNHFYLNLNSLESAEIDVRIYNMQGVLMFNQSVNWTGQQIPINISSLNSGVYVLEVKHQKNKYKSKLNKL